MRGTEPTGTPLYDIEAQFSRPDPISNAANHDRKNDDEYSTTDCESSAQTSDTVVVSSGRTSVSDNKHNGKAKAIKTTNRVKKPKGDVESQVSSTEETPTKTDKKTKTKRKKRAKHAEKPRVSVEEEILEEKQVHVDTRRQRTKPTKHSKRAKKSEVSIEETTPDQHNDSNQTTKHKNSKHGSSKHKAKKEALDNTSTIETPGTVAAKENGVMVELPTGAEGTAEMQKEESSNGLCFMACARFLAANMSTQDIAGSSDANKIADHSRGTSPSSIVSARLVDDGPGNNLNVKRMTPVEGHLIQRNGEDTGIVRIYPHQVQMPVDSTPEVTDEDTICGWKCRLLFTVITFLVIFFLL